MTRIAVVLERILLALWLGGGVFVAIAAPAAFATAPTRVVAANVVGAMLMRWHYIAIIAPLALLVLEIRRAKTSTARVVLLSLALVFASLEAFADLRIRALRQSAPMTMVEMMAPRDRAKFRMLHGLSSSLLLLQIAMGVGVAVAKPEE